MVDFRYPRYVKRNFRYPRYVIWCSKQLVALRKTFLRSPYLFPQLSYLFPPATLQPLCPLHASRGTSQPFPFGNSLIQHLPIPKVYPRPKEIPSPRASSSREVEVSLRLLLVSQAIYELLRWHIRPEKQIPIKVLPEKLFDSGQMIWWFRTRGLRYFRRIFVSVR